MDTTLFEFISSFMMAVPDHFKTHKLCNEAVRREPRLLAYAPDHLKIQGICSKAVRREPYVLRSVPNHLKTQEMCDTAVLTILKLKVCVLKQFR